MEKARKIFQKKKTLREEISQHTHREKDKKQDSLPSTQGLKKNVGPVTFLSDMMKMLHVSVGKNFCVRA